jgi:hypothetical protein
MAEVQAITDEQMKEIEKMIIRFFNLGKMSLFAAKGLIFLLRKSENLTKGVALTFDVKNQLDQGREVSFAAHDISSSGAGTNRINGLLAKMNHLFRLYGYHDWFGLGASLCPGDSGHKKEEKIFFTIEEIESIQIES